MIDTLEKSESLRDLSDITLDAFYLKVI